RKTPKNRENLVPVYFRISIIPIEEQRARMTGNPSVGTLTVSGDFRREGAMTKTIVLADRSNIIRYGLRSLLDVHTDFRIIGEAAGGWETIQVVSRLKPNVLILDWGLARRGSMEVLRRAQQRSLGTQIILFSLD